MVDYLHRELEGDAGQHLALAASAGDIEEAKAADKCALILGIEGADSLKGDLGMLRTLYRLGLRHVLLAHVGLARPGASTIPTWTGRAA
jgi:membrane dipeptidase